MAIRIPGTNKLFSQPNNSDVFGNIHYTRNINFDEEGYIKLSHRSVSFQNDSDEANFGLVISLGRKQLDSFYAVTNGAVYELQANVSVMSATQDTDSDGDAPPAPDFDSQGKWFNNEWHVSDDTTVVSKNPGNGNWTDRITGLTSGYGHALEVFKSRNSICVANGNVVKQYNSSYSNTTDLTIPSQYEISSLAYNGAKMAVATRLASTASGQNDEAYFFVWSGASTSAGVGYGVGSDVILSVKPYKSSFILLTRTGSLLYFNGGGFDVLTSLPHYYTDVTWGDSVNLEGFGDMITVVGDVVYLNVNNRYEDFGIKGEETLVNAPGGILCYDPKVGLYHRFSMSASKIGFLTVSTSNVNTTTNVITCTVSSDFAALPATGNPIKYLYDSSSLIGGLQTGKVYYIIKESSTTFKLATTKENALIGTAIDLTSQSSSTSYFMSLDLVDYGATHIARTGVIALPEKNTHTINTLLMSADMYQTATGTSSDFHLCFPCAGFKNIGCIVYPKISAQELTDQYQKLFLKHRPLSVGDRIIVKVKEEDVVGIPVTTPQGAIRMEWMGTNSLSTTANLSEVEDYINNGNGYAEIEITDGAGAGQFSQISSINVENGTYAITLEDDMDGVSSGDFCDIIIDNYRVLETITYDNQTKGIAEIPTDRLTSKWVKFKLILEGVEVTIEEFLSIKKTHQHAR